MAVTPGCICFYTCYLRYLTFCPALPSGRCYVLYCAQALVEAGCALQKTADRPLSGGWPLCACPRVRLWHPIHDGLNPRSVLGLALQPQGPVQRRGKMGRCGCGPRRELEPRKASDGASERSERREAFRERVSGWKDRGVEVSWCWLS